LGICEFVVIKRIAVRKNWKSSEIAGKETQKRTDGFTIGGKGQASLSGASSAATAHRLAPVLIAPQWFK
jgi:hypothetical protein